MNIKVTRSVLSGEIEVPGSKSHTIRAVAVASLAKGVSSIRAPLVSGDTVSALGAAEAFGAKVRRSADVWEVEGVGGSVREHPAALDLGNSGTSLRIFSGLAATSPFKWVFDGDASLRTRPMGPLLDALASLGVETGSDGGKCPVWVRGPLRGGSARIEGKSSQFVTSLLFACPLALGGTTLEVFRLNERPYVEITIDWLRRQGIEFECAADLSVFKIRGGQSYKAFDFTIPADFSTATFPLVAAAVTGGRVGIRNLDFSDRQGDKEVFARMARMGVEVKKGPVTEVRAPGGMDGAEIDLNDTPDALPAMAVAACFARGRTSLVNVPQARIKETDRIACMTRELQKMGARVTELEDGMVVEGGAPLRGAEVESYDDHRIAMAMTIAGMGAEGVTVVKGAECAAVTYPGFIEDFKKLGAKIETAP